MPCFNIPDGRALSLGGLIYGMRSLNNRAAPRWNTIIDTIKKDKYNRKRLGFLRQYIRLFNYYKNDDWHYIFKIDDNNKEVIKNKFYVNSLIDIFSKTYRNSDIGFDDHKRASHKNTDYDVQQHTEQFNCVLENYLQNNNTHFAQNRPRYDSIVLDTNDIYTLRFVRIPKNIETVMRDHDGLCFYRMINPWLNSNNKGIIRSINYTNDKYDYDEPSLHYNIHNTHDIIAMTYITNDYLNILHVNEFHQLKAINDDCYSLNLYFHGFDIYRERS